LNTLPSSFNSTQVYPYQQGAMDKNSSQKWGKLVHDSDKPKTAKRALVSLPAGPSSMSSDPDVSIEPDTASSTTTVGTEKKKQYRKRLTEVDRLQGDEGVQRMIEENLTRPSSRQRDRRSLSSTPSERRETPASTDSLDVFVRPAEPTSSTIRDASPPHIIPSDAEERDEHVVLPMMEPMVVDTSADEDDYDAIEKSIGEKLKKMKKMESSLKSEKEVLLKEKADLQKTLEEKFIEVAGVNVRYEELVKQFKEKENEVAGVNMKYEDLSKQLKERDNEVASLKSSKTSLEMKLKEEKDERRKEKEELCYEISDWRINAENERFARTKEKEKSDSVIKKLEKKFVDEKNEAASDYAKLLKVYRDISMERNEKLVEEQKKYSTSNSPCRCTADSGAPRLARIDFSRKLIFFKYSYLSVLIFSNSNSPYNFASESQFIHILKI
ncbi:hypothetical protein PMAYCL1PPCAC_08025, partial [Pristionchus mayeri]